MKRAAVLAGTLLLAAIVWIAWEFQPRMPAGRAIRLSDSHIGEYEFQVWQRKNSTPTEPFTTSLFARKQGGKWMRFMLDFEDSYRPSISLKKENSGIAVFRDTTQLGIFSESQQNFTRVTDKAVFPPAEIEGDPPGGYQP